MTLVIDDFTGAERDILVRAGVRREDATLEGTVLHRLTLDRTLSEETYRALAGPDGFLSDRDLAALLPAPRCAELTLGLQFRGADGHGRRARRSRRMSRRFRENS